MAGECCDVLKSVHLVFQEVWVQGKKTEASFPFFHLNYILSLKQKARLIVQTEEAQATKTRCPDQNNS